MLEATSTTDFAISNSQEEGENYIITHYDDYMEEIVSLSSTSLNCLNRKYSLILIKIVIILKILESEMDAFVVIVGQMFVGTKFWC